MAIVCKAEILLAVARKCLSIMTVVACLFVSGTLLSPAVGNAASGRADKVFDKAFLQSVKDVVSYEQVVRIVGVQGEKVGSDSLKIPGDKYHWNGRENSSFNIRVNAGRVIDANVVTPDGRIISLDKSLEGSGEVHDLGK
ncbi:MAG: hypothetical protein M0T70_03340 [Geobacteraceae bacterium]|nr:hypothetical protein [Geobacteraceae bacterium]